MQLGSVFALLLVGVCHLIARTYAMSRDVNIALLYREGRRVNPIALENAKKWAQKYIVSGEGVYLKILETKVTPGKSLSNEILFNKNLSSASFLLEPYHVDSRSCILSDLLKIPLVSMTDVHSGLCLNVLSMRPSPGQLFRILNEFISEDKPQRVGVVVEDGLGTMASHIVSLGETSNANIYYQIVTTVDFGNEDSIKMAAQNVVGYINNRFLLLMRSYHTSKLIGAVKKLKDDLDDVRWFVPMLEELPGDDLQLLGGLTGLQIPTDHDKLKKTLNEIDIMKTTADKKIPNYKTVDPLLHDAIAVIAQTVKDARFHGLDLTHKTDRNQQMCPFKRHPHDPSVTDIMKQVVLEGVTGKIRFTKDHYRNITDLDAKEVSKDEAKITKMGHWSEMCQLFRWEEGKTFPTLRDKANCASEKKRKQLHGSIRPMKNKLRIVTLPEAPFIFFNESLGKGNDRFFGFSKDLLERLSSELGFEYELYIVEGNPPSYGKCMNETDDTPCQYTGLLGDIQKKKADIGIGSITITSEREKYVDFSKSFMDFTMTLLMKKPEGQVYKIFAFMEPFDGAVWLSIFVVALIVTLILYCIDRQSPNGCRQLANRDDSEMTGQEFALSNCLWFATASILQQGPDYTPKSPAARILSASFWFFTLIIISTYTANLAAFFTTSQADTGIKSLEDLAKQDKIEYGIRDSGQTYSLFEKGTTMLHKHMFAFMKSRETFAPTTAGAVDRVREGGYAFLSEDPILYYMHQRRPCNTVVVRNLLEAKSYGLVLQSQSEWTNPISVVILNLREQGFIDSIKSNWWDERSECGTESTNTPGNPISLKLTSVAGVYVIMAGGIVVAILLLLVEMRYKKLLGGRCLHKDYDFKRNQNKKTLNPDIAYMDYGDADPYDLALQKLHNQMNGSQEFTSNKMKRKVYLHCESPVSEHYDPPDLYRNAPESTL